MSSFALPQTLVLPESIAWVVLIAGGVCELLWARALVPAPTADARAPQAQHSGSAKRRALAGTAHTHAVRALALRITAFVLGLALSLSGLALALTAIEVTTAYAVWVGVGALSTLAYSLVRGHEHLTWLRALFIACLLGGAVGLKAVG